MKFTKVGEIAHLNAVIAIGVVVERLKLLVDDPDASLVRANDDVFDVLGGLAIFLETGIDVLPRFN